MVRLTKPGLSSATFWSRSMGIQSHGWKMSTRVSRQKPSASPLQSNWFVVAQYRTSRSSAANARAEVNDMVFRGFGEIGEQLGRSRVESLRGDDTRVRRVTVELGRSLRRGESVLAWRVFSLSLL